ncbi:hypothetical protein A2U01_0032775, partial [Trifolium medium]|nr:hypothetical protein [Trifolium medium]
WCDEWQPCFQRPSAPPNFQISGNLLHFRGVVLRLVCWLNPSWDCATFCSHLFQDVIFGSTRFGAASIFGGGSRFVRGFHQTVVAFVDVATAPSISGFPFDITTLSSFCLRVVSVMFE